MPTSHEIFAQMPPAVAEQLFTFLAEKETPLYESTIDALARQRNLRVIFVKRKPRGERHAWMREALGRKVNGTTGAHLLQIWLVAAHAPLLCDFLDGLGIALIVPVFTWLGYRGHPYIEDVIAQVQRVERGLLWALVSLLAVGLAWYWLWSRRRRLQQEQRPTEAFVQPQRPVQEDSKVAPPPPPAQE